MPDADDERLAEICEEVWVQVRDLEPADILKVLLVMTAEVIAANDAPKPCLNYACKMLGDFVRRAPGLEAEARRAQFRLVPKEPA